MPDDSRNPLARLFNTAREVMYGMASHDMSRYALRTRASMEHLFILITMGDLLGVPILPPYYSLRLLPYVVPQISTWKRRMLRERDITDALDEHVSLLSQQITSRPYVMWGGKGGLGKTTFSAATGFWLAEQGKKVLVFSVDPQASLSDIFQQDIFGKGPVKIMDNLWAQEIDADSHIKAYQQEIRQKILDLYGFTEVPEEVENYIQAASAEPAMEESAIFDAVVDIVVTGSYDYYIYDLVPLGHALYYLSMAKVYDEWINKITKLRQEMGEYEQVANVMKRQKASEEDLILQELQYIKGRINASSSILTDRAKTAFFFVVVPEEMIILDTQKAAELFAKFDVPIAGYVVNRVLPAELAQQNIPAYLKNRITMQDKYLAQIDRTLGTQVLARVPELERDVTGLAAIERLARIMYG
jgi:arsenite-transporting ATPase